MEVLEKTQDGVSVLSLNGRLDANTSSGFRGKIFKVIGDGRNNIVLDFEGLDYVSSAGLRVILEAVKALKRSGGKLVICSLKDYIREIFEVSKFDAFMPIASTLENALKEF